MNLFFIFKLVKRFFKPTFVLWASQGFTSPAPQKVKMSVLRRHAQQEGIWIETGTYFGDTTKLLSKIATKVISLEPDKEIFEFARKRLGKYKNVDLQNGTSEALFDQICQDINSKVNFWLDGHYSGDITFQGKSVTPISFELGCISNLIARDIRVTVCIDDFRLFVDQNEKGYPLPRELVAWAESNKLSWTVEHDIFIATS